MNIHHLEIFYYVARHGGISEAVRKFPYGIQQPAVSSQIIQLERSLGTKLFQRRPFALTAAGERLFAFIQPFFGDIAKVADELQGKAARFVRIGASGPVLRYHMPQALQNVRATMPGLTFNLFEGYELQLSQMLKKNEIDLAVTVLNEAATAGLSAVPLISIPLTLLVPKNSRIRDAAELWKRDTIDEPLISLPVHDSVAASFQRGLQKLGVDWTPALSVSSLELIETYVAEGYGIGASIVVPGVKVPPGLRRVSLPGFDPVVVGALWAGEGTPLIRKFVEAFQQYVKGLAAEG